MSVYLLVVFHVGENPRQPSLFVWIDEGSLKKPAVPFKMRRFRLSWKDGTSGVDRSFLFTEPLFSERRFVAFDFVSTNGKCYVRNNKLISRRAAYKDLNECVFVYAPRNWHMELIVQDSKRLYSSSTGKAVYIDAPTATKG